MVETAVFTYGLLASFVLSGAARNKRMERPNPAMLTYLGYVLVGVSGSASALLSGYAVWQSI